MPVRLLTNPDIAPLAHIEMEMIAVGGIRFWTQHSPKDLAGIAMDRSQERLCFLSAYVPLGYRSLGLLLLRHQNFGWRDEHRLEEGMCRHTRELFGFFSEALMIERLIGAA